MSIMLEIASLIPSRELESADLPIEPLINDIKANGLLNAILVIMTINFTDKRVDFTIGQGHRRVEAFKRIGWTSIKAEIRAINFK